MTAPAPAPVNAARTDDTLVVAEAFGPTIQGEGPSAGRLAYFIRTGGCDLACSWCDTPYTWDASRYNLRTELTRTPVANLLEPIPWQALVVITGGEPLLHQAQAGWARLLNGLALKMCDVEIETNGVHAPNHVTLTHRTRFNVSPKLPHAGMPADCTVKPPALKALNRTGRAVFKFVCREAADADRAADIADAVGIPRRRVWLMPEGATAAVLADRTPGLADAAVRLGVNFTTRLHVLAWGDERGR